MLKVIIPIIVLTYTLQAEMSNVNFIPPEDAFPSSQPANELPIPQKKPTIEDEIRTIKMEHLELQIEHLKLKVRFESLELLLMMEMSKKNPQIKEKDVFRIKLN